MTVEQSIDWSTPQSSKTYETLYRRTIGYNGFTLSSIFLSPIYAGLYLAINTTLLNGLIGFFGTIVMIVILIRSVRSRMRRELTMRGLTSYKIGDPDNVVTVEDAISSTRLPTSAIRQINAYREGLVIRTHVYTFICVPNGAIRDALERGIDKSLP